MKKTLLLTLMIIIACLQHVHSQDKAENQPRKLSLINRGGVFDTYYYSPPVSRAMCIEGCPVDERSSSIRKTFNVGLIYQVDEKNLFAVLIGYSEFGYKHKGRYSIGGFPVYPYESYAAWKYWGLEAEYIRELFKIGKISFMLGNGFRFDSPIYEKYMNRDEYNFFEEIGISYNGRLGAEFQISENVFLSGNGLYKSSLTHYNKEIFEKYRPYGLGGEIGIRVKL